MATREQMGTNIAPGVIARVVDGLRYVVSGVGPENWFGPQQPMTPQAQEKTQGRAFDYPVGYNLQIQPRAGEAVSFSDLRAMADGYDLLRLVIETRKDQIESYEWEIVPKEKGADGDQFKDQIKLVHDFLDAPDKEHDWSEWLRASLEDIFVIDAWCVYPRMTRGGQLYAFELVDGATIKRVIDDSGRTPMPPSPAYQQILKGIPAADYTREDLVYRMRNPRTWKLYGYSPVEQIIMTINIALRRQISQLEYYTSGNVPEALAQVPETWTLDEVKEFQLWYDSILTGQLGERRKLRFLPKLDGILFPKSELTKDAMDEWLARIICYAFSVSPSALMAMVNRATSEQVAVQAKEEGLMPWLKWIERKMNFLIHTYIPAAPDVKFAYKVQEQVNVETQSKVNVAYVGAKIITADEARESIGKAPLTQEQKDELHPPMPMMGGEIDPKTGLPIEPKGEDPMKQKPGDKKNVVSLVPKKEEAA